MVQIVGDNKKPTETIDREWANDGGKDFGCEWDYWKNQKEFKDM